MNPRLRCLLMAAVVMTTLIAHQRLLLIALGALHVVREQRKHALYRALRDWLASLMFRRPRRPRSYWAEQRRACLWHAMQLSWPGLPRHAEDQKYYSHFRVNKTGFKYLLSLVRGGWLRAPRVSPPPPPAILLDSCCMQSCPRCCFCELFLAGRKSDWQGLP